jgi:flagellar biosynthesis activator protein FlaF
VNAIEQAQRAYAPAHSPLRSGRSVEHQAFTSVTMRLARAAEEMPTSFPQLAEALHENRQLWTVLAADVADDGNLLPRELRAQIFYLAEFTAHHSNHVLRGTADAFPLIAINTAIIRGLSGFAAVAETI